MYLIQHFIRVWSLVIYAFCSFKNCSVRSLKLNIITTHTHITIGIVVDEESIRQSRQIMRNNYLCQRVGKCAHTTYETHRVVLSTKIMNGARKKSLDGQFLMVTITATQCQIVSHSQTTTFQVWNTEQVPAPPDFPWVLIGDDDHQ